MSPPFKSRIQGVFESLKKEGRVAFIPYLTAGDPDLAATELFVETLVRAGSSIIELGVPFSDPLADGPVNQRAASRALKSGTSLAGVIGLVSRLRARGIGVPLVLFTYYNPVYMMGHENFARLAREAGVDGVLTVDLPPEEAVEYRRILGAHGLDTIFLGAPTTSPDRLRLIDEASTGFMYYVSRAGTTGAQSELSTTLAAELHAVRGNVRNPFVVGFGISTPEQARAVALLADGVVIGSAIVQRIETGPSPAASAESLFNFTRSIVSAIQIESQIETQTEKNDRK